MKNKKLLTLLASITLATSGVGIVSVMSSKNVQAVKSKYIYYSATNNCKVYDSTGNAIPNSSAWQSNVYPVTSNNNGTFTISTINGNKYLKIGNDSYLRLDDLTQLIPIGIYVVKHNNIPIYNESGNPIGKGNVLFEGSKIAAFKISNIKGIDYIYIGDNEYLRMSDVKPTSSIVANNSNNIVDDIPTVTASKYHGKTGNQKGLIRKFTVPKSWRGEWYRNDNARLDKSLFVFVKLYAHKYTMGLEENNQLADRDTIELWNIGFVRGTTKFPWQMSQAWIRKNYWYVPKFTAYWENIRGHKWIVTSTPTDKPNLKSSTCYLVKNEMILGKKYKVLFLIESNSKLKVTRQFFRTPKFGKKYAHHRFADMHYTSSFKRN